MFLQLACLLALVAVSHGYGIGHAYGHGYGLSYGYGKGTNSMLVKLVHNIEQTSRRDVFNGA